MQSSLDDLVLEGLGHGFTPYAYACYLPAPNPAPRAIAERGRPASTKAVIASRRTAGRAGMAISECLGSGISRPLHSISVLRLGGRLPVGVLPVARHP